MLQSSIWYLIVLTWFLLIGRSDQNALNLTEEKARFCSKTKLRIDGACNDLDTRSEGQIFLFTGPLFWTFSGRRKQITKVDKITNKWPEIRNYTAVTSTENFITSNAYIFAKGNNVLIYNNTKNLTKTSLDELQAMSNVAADDKIACLTINCNDQSKCQYWTVYKGQNMFTLVCDNIESPNYICNRKEGFWSPIDLEPEPKFTEDDTCQAMTLETDFKDKTEFTLINNERLDTWINGYLSQSIQIAELFDCKTASKYNYKLLYICVGAFTAGLLIVFTLVGTVVYIRNKRQSVSNISTVIDDKLVTFRSNETQQVDLQSDNSSGNKYNPKSDVQL